MKRISLAVVIATILGALVLAGCGGSSGGSSSTDGRTTASSVGGGEGARFAISAADRRCLKEMGVEVPAIKAGEGPQIVQKGEMPEGRQMPEGGQMPDGGPPGAVGGEMGEEDAKAFEECGVEMPEFKAGPGAEGGGPNVNSAAFEKEVKEYVACVRENGYELAEPDFSGEGPIFDKSESESAAFKKASEKCQGLLGGPGPGGPGGETEES